MSGDDINKAIEDADAAFGRSDLAEARRILDPFVRLENAKARATLGTMLALGGDPSTFIEGVAMLRELADAGEGYAAHHLAMALNSPLPGAGCEPDRAAYLHCMGIATESGFEASVASDPDWWQPNDGQKTRPSGTSEAG